MAKKPEKVLATKPELEKQKLSVEIAEINENRRHHKIKLWFSWGTIFVSLISVMFGGYEFLAQQQKERDFNITSNVIDTFTGFIKYKEVKKNGQTKYELDQNQAQASAYILRGYGPHAVDFILDGLMEDDLDSKVRETLIESLIYIAERQEQEKKSPLNLILKILGISPVTTDRDSIAISLGETISTQIGQYSGSIISTKEIEILQDYNNFIGSYGNILKENSSGAKKLKETLMDIYKNGADHSFLNCKFDPDKGETVKNTLSSCKGLLCEIEKTISKDVFMKTDTPETKFKDGTKIDFINGTRKFC